MRPIRQTKFGDPEGNCLEACIATITGIDLAEIPHYMEGWFDAYSAWLRARGWCVAWWEVGAGSVPPGLAIANGPAVRGLGHSVVTCDGVLAHDPHPSGVGVLEVHSWMLLWPEDLRVREFPEVGR